MQNFTNKIYLNYLPDSLDEDEYEPQRGQHHEPHELLLVPERVRVRGVEAGHGGRHRGVDVAVCVALVVRHQQLEFLDLKVLRITLSWQVGSLKSCIVVSCKELKHQVRSGETAAALPPGHDGTRHCFDHFNVSVRPF